MTFAPETTAPLGSLMVPTMLPVSFCAQTVTQSAMMAASVKRVNTLERGMATSWGEVTSDCGSRHCGLNGVTVSFCSPN